MHSLTKARKNSFKKPLLTLIFISVLALGLTNYAGAVDNVIIGNTNSAAWDSMSNTGTGTGRFSGLGPVNSSISLGYMELAYGSFFMSGGAPYKFLIYDANGTLLFISPERTPPAGRLTSGAWDNVYFPAGLTVRDNQNLVFGVTTMWSDIQYIYDPGNTQITSYNFTVNMYDSPTDLVFGSFGDHYLYYLTMMPSAYPGNMGGSPGNYGLDGGTISGPSSTPAPSTTASPAPDNITTIIDTAITTQNIMLVIALLIIIIPAILGAKFAGGWGFLIGATAGVGLDYLFGLVTLWFIVLIGIVDAVALIRGMTGSGKSNSGTV